MLFFKQGPQINLAVNFSVHAGELYRRRMWLIGDNRDTTIGVGYKYTALWALTISTFGLDLVA